nr:MAG TPA: hypothetical protein [Caudoviricetes sp.]
MLKKGYLKDFVTFFILYYISQFSLFKVNFSEF